MQAQQHQHLSPPCSTSWRSRRLSPVVINDFIYKNDQLEYFLTLIVFLKHGIWFLNLQWWHWASIWTQPKSAAYRLLTGTHSQWTQYITPKGAPKSGFQVCSNSYDSPPNRHSEKSNCCFCRCDRIEYICFVLGLALLYFLSEMGFNDKKCKGILTNEKPAEGEARSCFCDIFILNAFMYLDNWNLFISLVKSIYFERNSCFITRITSFSPT